VVLRNLKKWLSGELEGVVAKRRSGRYQPGERGWVRVKNRDYWRWEIERGAVWARSS
jgi:ATP-dependent DNA ligase